MTPRDHDAERAVLGACLLSPVAYDRASAVLAGGDFDAPTHEVVWQAFGTARRQGALDVVTVAPLVRAACSCKQPEACIHRAALEVLPTLVDAAPLPDSVEHYARIVRGCAVRRRLITEAMRLRQQAESPSSDPLTLATDAVAAITAVRDYGSTDDITAVTLGELVDAPDEPYDWVIPDLLERADRFVLTGHEGLGKSTMLRQIAVMAAAGLHPFTGQRITAVKSVVIDSENTLRHVRRKMRPMAIVAAKQGHDPRNSVFIDCPGRLDITRDRDLARVHRLLDAVQPDIVVIGPLYRLVPRAVQNDDDAAPLLTALDTIRDRGVCLLMEAHAGHTIAKGGERDMRPRGSSALLGWPEFGYGLRPHPDHLVEMVSWRGDRDERAWPEYLRRGGDWPWSAVDTVWHNGTRIHEPALSGTTPGGPNA